MALPDLHWRMMVYETQGSVTDVETLLDAIYDMYTNNDYYDGETRSGHTSAWSMARYQDTGTTEALYFTPPASAISELRVIIAGQTSATKTPTMDLDAFTANDLIYGFNKGSGSFNAWDNASPFTTGNFSGYNGAGISVGATIDWIYAYECEEAMGIFVVYTGGSFAHTGFVAGCYIDPISVDSSDAETTERIYCGCNGATSTDSSNVLFNGQYNYLFEQSGSNRTHYHHRGFDPGAGTKRTIGKYVGANALNALATLNSKQRLALPIEFKDVDSHEFVGYGRSMYFMSDVQAGSPVYDKDGILGYPLTFRTYQSTAMDGIVLRA